MLTRIRKPTHTHKQINTYTCVHTLQDFMRAHNSVLGEGVVLTADRQTSGKGGHIVVVMVAEWWFFYGGTPAR